MILIRIRMDLELLPGSGTWKIQSWFRIRNKSFRIHNTDFKGQYHKKCMRNSHWKMLKLKLGLVDAN